MILSRGPSAILVQVNVILPLLAIIGWYCFACYVLADQWLARQEARRQMLAEIEWAIERSDWALRGVR